MLVGRDLNDDNELKIALKGTGMGTQATLVADITLKSTINYSEPEC